MAQYDRWSDDLLDALSSPFPESCIEWVDKGDKNGKLLPSVHWTEYVRRLNDLVGEGWSMGDPILQTIRFSDKEGKETGRVVVGLPITILGVTRINFGDEDDDKIAYGSGVTTAWAQAVKRTCSLFGLGMYLYDMPPKWANEVPAQQKGESRAPRQSRSAPDTSTPWLDRPVNFTKKTNIKGKTWREVLRIDPGFAEWASNKGVDALTAAEHEELKAALSTLHRAEAEQEARQPTRRMAIPEPVKSPFDPDDDDLPF